MAQNSEATNDKKSATYGEVKSEIGNLGLKINGGLVVSETRKDLQFPYCVATYDQMEQNIVIASALSIVNVIASRTPYYFESYDESDRHKKRKDFVEQVFNDMVDQTLDEFIREAMSVNKYGFSIHEKVFYFRRKKNGSKYDDGKIGIKRLPIRSQGSIAKWKFDEKVRTVLGCYQKEIDLVDLQNGLITLKTTFSDDTFIPRDRFLLIRDNATNGNPEGKSKLSYCYNHWRKLQNLLETEEIATVKNLNGVPVVKIPSIYMTETATDEQKMTYKVMKDGVTKLGIGEQQSIILPSDVDENGKPYFDFSIVQSSASNISAISSVVKTRSDQILQALFADALIMAQGTSSSVANKRDMLSMVVESLLDSIFAQVNKDLIPDLFRRNGWDDTKTPKLKRGDIFNMDFAAFAKAMQQLKATKLIAVTPDNINYIAEVMSLPYRVPHDATKEELDEILGVEGNEDASKSGQGYSTDSGGLNGTGNSVSETDNSADNLENA